jgi:hypothetical protein
VITNPNKISKTIIKKISFCIFFSLNKNYFFLLLKIFIG